jgi:hypothetical protein
MSHSCSVWSDEPVSSLVKKKRGGKGGCCEFHEAGITDRASRHTRVSSQFLA